MRVVHCLLLTVGLSFAASGSRAQTSGQQGEVRDTTYKGSGVETLTLRQCIEYAMLHQPALNKALLNVDVTRQTNGVNLAAWLPQLNASGNLVHYFQQSNGGVGVNTGSGGTSGTISTTRSSVTNTFIPGVAVSQAIFSPSLLYASKTAPLYLQEARQATDSTKIFLVTAVTKSFYNLLLTLEQINVLKEDTARLSKNLADAYHQYKGGIVDETDYQEAGISLNNSKAQLKQQQENVIPQYASLKQLIGYPAEKHFNVDFDTLRMKSFIDVDTTQQLQYEKRIEYQLINTDKALQQQTINYYRRSFLPTVSGFFNYNLEFENNQLSNLFQSSYPSSLIGLSVSIPIFTGFARLHNLQKAKLQEREIEWDQTDLKARINTEYTSALATYKSNRYNLQVLEKNVQMATRVYFVVTLQYKEGIVPYLNVITAESNLISSKINYLNALFQTITSKVDLEKAMGNITY